MSKKKAERLAIEIKDEKLKVLMGTCFTIDLKDESDGFSTAKNKSSLPRFFLFSDQDIQKSRIGILNGVALRKVSFKK
jgi:hypothetical protein